MTFRESGLPSGSSWSATLNGTTESSTGSPIAFTEVNGTYPYSITTSRPGWGSTEPYGTVAVLGVPVVVAETFVTLYLVTFTESTLPSGTNWTATASGTVAPVAGGSAASQRYTVTQWSDGAASVVIPLPNGTYAYSASAPGYSSSSGAILVTGRSPPVVSVLFVNQNPSSSSAVPAWVYEVTAVLIVVVVVGVVVAVRRPPPPVAKRAPPPARPPNRAR